MDSGTNPSHHVPLTTSTTFYALDAQGNTMAVYEYKENPGTAHLELTCKEEMIYGNSRIGVLHRNEIICDNCVDMGGLENSIYDEVDALNYVAPATTPPADLQEAWLGTREYELSNHLGNVLVTIADRKLFKKSDILGSSLVFQYRPQVVTSVDYYPFGMMLPGRNCPSQQCSTVTTNHNDVVINNTCSSLTGFTSISAAAIAIASDMLVMYKPTGDGWGAKTSMAQTSGKNYTITFDLNIGSCIGRTIKAIIKNPSGVVITEQSYTTSGTKSFTFTGTATGTGAIEFIMFSGAGNCQFFIDNIHVTHDYETSEMLCDDTKTYRFGFNGQMKDNEVYGEGNSYTAEFWQYDPRLGRRWNVDPLVAEFPWQSPYATFNNRPINTIDKKGLKGESTGVKKNEDGTYTVVGAREDGDNGIYIVNKDNEWDKNSEKIAYTTKQTDFMTTDDKTGAFTFDKSIAGITFSIDKLTVSGTVKPNDNSTATRNNLNAFGLIAWAQELFNQEIENQAPATFYGQLEVLQSMSANNGPLDFKASLGLGPYTPLEAGTAYDGKPIITTLRAASNVAFGANMRYTKPFIFSADWYYSQTMPKVGEYNQTQNGGNGYNSGHPYYGEHTYSGSYIYYGFFGSFFNR